MHRGRLIGVVVGAMLALPASASAVPFGLPLGTAPFNVAPNYPYDCSVIYNPFRGQPFPFLDPTQTRAARSSSGPTFRHRPSFRPPTGATSRWSRPAPGR